VVVNLHRSWTGKKIAEAGIQIERGGTGREKGGWWVRSVVWKSDEGVIRGMSEEVAKERCREVCRWVMGVELGEEVVG
jgi:hypothetical protein